MADCPKPSDPILIVDDDDRVIESVNITLQSLGYDNVVSCSDSRRVGGMLEERAFSLMLLDLNMPYVSGHEIIRALAGRRGPPIVILAASTKLDDYLEGLSAGVVDHLVKPVERRRLVEAVERALAASATPGRATEAPAASHVREEYRRLLGALPIPYIILEPDTLRLRFHNEAFSRFVESACTEGEARGCFTDLFDETTAERVRAALRDKADPAGVELRGTSRSGDPFVLAGAFRANETDGTVEGVFVDITETARLEKKLAAAQRAEAVGSLAAGLAHDFNNLLLVIGGHASIILGRGDIPEPARKSVTEIASAVDRAAIMIRELLASGKQRDSARSHLSLHAELRRMESGLRFLLHTGQRLALRLEAAEPAIEAGATFVEQVVHNLVLNARDAMPDGGDITISTSDGPGDSTGTRGVMLEVRDTGSGMDKSTLARIFEPFFTTKTGGRGSGLGLTMTRSLVTSAGGSMTVESEPGVGTLVRVRLPRAAAAGRT